VTISFDKARSRWKFDFWHKGKRYQGYCLDAAGEPVTSKSAARQAEGVEKRRAVIAPKVADPRDVTLGQIVAVMQTRWQRDATWEDKKRQAREIVRYFGASTAMREITSDRIRAYTDFGLAQPLRIWTGGPGRDRDDEKTQALWKETGRTRSPATVNRYLSLLRQIIGQAAGMRDPHGRPVLDIVPQIKELPELKRRARPTPEPVLETVLEKLPPHAREAVILTLYFGFRKGEVFTLETPQADFTANGIWLSAEDVKDKEDAFLPGSPEAMAFLRQLVEQAKARGTRRLISYRRHPDSKKPGTWKPIAGARSAWKRVMDDVEKETGRRYRWHDLRAAFITHIALTSGPVAAQRMARHSDYETTQAYVEVADSIRRGAATDAARRPALKLIGAKKSP
jgi:site-specific recombinase XerD